MALSFDSTTSLVLVDVSLGPKTIQLPYSSERPGRVLTIKDSGYCSVEKSITITCAGSGFSGEKFDSGNSTYTIVFANGHITAVSDPSLPGWRVISKSALNIPPEFDDIVTLNLSSLTANFSTISTNNLNVDNISAMTTTIQRGYFTYAEIENLSVNVLFANIVSTAITQDIAAVTVDTAYISSATISSLFVFSTFASQIYVKDIYASQISSAIINLGFSTFSTTVGTLSNISLSSFSTLSTAISQLDYSTTVRYNSTMIGIQALTTASVKSTVQGLGSVGYVSTTTLVSYLNGLGSVGYVSTSWLQSTTQGLGSLGYLSSIAGINSAGNVGINAASNTSNSLFVNGSQSNTGAMYIAGQANVITTGSAILNLSNTTNANQLTLIGGVVGATNYSAQALAGDSVIRSEANAGLCLASASGINGGLRIAPTTAIITTTSNLIVGGRLSADLDIINGNTTNGFLRLTNAGGVSYIQSALAQTGSSVAPLHITGWFGSGAVPVYISGNVGIGGVYNTSNALLVTGSQSNTGAIFVGGALNVTGLGTFDNTSNTGTLGVAGLTTLTGRVGIGGEGNSSNALLVTGSQSNTGAMYIGDSLEVNGSINFTGVINSNGAPVVFTPPGVNSAGNVGINADSNTSNALLVNGTQSNTSNLFIGGALSVSGFIVKPGTTALAFGNLAGQTSQSDYAVAIGYQAGNSGQGNSAVAIGVRAGETGQRYGTIAIGDAAGRSQQLNAAVAIGVSAGQISQQIAAIAIGGNAGANTQNESAIAIGDHAGQSNQSTYSVAIGFQAGQANQSNSAVAIGYRAGNNSQQASAIAIGTQAGVYQQKASAVAIGSGAGSGNQSSNAIAIGSGAGYDNQQSSAIAMGVDAGAQNQGQYSIAIGYGTAYINQPANSIALNATGSSFTPPTTGFFVQPVRSNAGSYYNGPYSLTYDSYTGEIAYTAGGIAGINSSGNVGINSGSNSSNALLVNGSQSNTGAVFVGGALNVTGLGTFGNTSNTGTLGVAGLTTLVGRVGIGGEGNSSNALLVTGSQSNTGALYLGNSLEVNGSINFTGVINSNGAPVVFTPPGVNSAGNVGINKAASTYALDVKGNVNILGSSGISNDPTVFVGSDSILSLPTGVATASDGTIYVVNRGIPFICKITPAGVVSLLAGGSSTGNQDGTGANASFTAPTFCAIAPDGSLYVIQSDRIRKVTPTGVVTTLSPGPNNLLGICIDTSGNIYFNEATIIYKMSPTGPATTFAGSGNAALTDGTGTQASFVSITGLTIDSQNNMYVVDNYAIRKITPAGVVTTLAGNSTPGYVDAQGSDARFFGNFQVYNLPNPSAITCDSQGNVYVCDSDTPSSLKIRKITPTGLVTTIANSIFEAASLNFDPDGNMLSTAPSANRLYKYNAIFGNILTTSGGNVGINKATPAYKLDVDGSINFTGDLKKNGSNMTFTTPGINSIGRVGINSASNSSNALVVDGSQSNTGDVFIGGALSVTGAIRTNATNIAFGMNAGNSLQGENSVAIGNQAGSNQQRSNAVAIGYQAGNSGQQSSAVAIGYQAATFGQGEGAVAIGNYAGGDQQSNAIAIGNGAAPFNQGINAIAIGYAAGGANQSSNSIVINASGQFLGASEPGLFVKPVRSNAGTYSLNYTTTTGEISYAPVANTLGINSVGNVSINTASNGSNALFVSGSQSNTGTLYLGGSLEVTSGKIITPATSISFGNEAGQTSQAQNAVAIGNSSGKNNQSSNAVAIGYRSGNSNQSSNAVAIGNNAGSITQGETSIAIGYLAGQANQSAYSIALNASGVALNPTTTGFFVNPVRSNAGTYSLNYTTTTGEISYAAVANSAGVNSAGNVGINAASNASYALYVNGSQSNTGILYLGSSLQLTTGKIVTSDRISIGCNAGATGQSNNCTAIGFNAGNSNQRNAAIAIGFGAGRYNQSGDTAIGFNAGSSNQGQFSVAIGSRCGESNQSANCIAIGRLAGQTNQPEHSIALNASGSVLNPATTGFFVQPVRNNAGTYSLTYDTTSGEISYSTAPAAGINSSGNVGINAAANASYSLYVNGSQSNSGATYIGGALSVTGSIKTNGTQSVTFGNESGLVGQSNFCVAIGYSVARSYQGQYAVAIGAQAGLDYQQEYSVAIGYAAGQNSQAANSIALNASGLALNPTTTGFFVKPVRNNAGTYSLSYNDSTGEISYTAGGGGIAGINSTGLIGINSTPHSSGSYSLYVEGSQLNTGNIILAGFNDSRIGIGTSTPRAPLDVVGSAFNSISVSYVLSSSGLSNYNDTFNVPISIYANNNIYTTNGFVVSSDERIKKNINSVTDSLDIVNKLNLVSFNYIDFTKPSVKHGLIAQEVKAVYPEAITVVKDYIPSVYKLATKYEKVGCKPLSTDGEKVLTLSTDGEKVLPLSTDDEKYNVIITSPIPHGFVVNNKIKLFINQDGKGDTSDFQCETDVLEVLSDTEFVVKPWDDFALGKDLLIYGKEVDDFLTIDKPLIGVIAAGACKILSQQVSTLQQENIELRSTIHAILQKYPLS